MKPKYSIAILAVFAVSTSSLQSCFSSPFDGGYPSDEQLKTIEWQRNFDGSQNAYRCQDFAEAERFGNAAVKIAEGFEPDDHRLYTTLHNLVFVYEDQKKWAEAERLQMRSLQVAKGNPMRTAEVYSGLATLYSLQRNFVKEDEMLAAALVAAESGASKTTSSSPEDVELLGRLLVHAKRYAEAEPVVLQALQMQEKRYGADQPLIVHSLLNLARLYVFEDKLSEAEPLYKRAIVICENMTPPSSGQLASALSMYAELLDKLTRPAEAKKLHERSERLINAPQP